MNEYTYEDVYVGMKEAFSVSVDEKKLKQFLEISGDINPLHNDEKYAQSKGFVSKVVYGMLTSSFISTLVGVHLPGKYSVIHSVETKFLNPVYVGDELEIEGIVASKEDKFKLVVIKVNIRNQDGKKVCRGIVKVGMLNGE